jgi:hypothetical protein
MLKTFINYLRIKESGEFDPRYYLLKYPDIRKSDVDPLMHYTRYGWKEGRYPSAEWETKISSGEYQFDLTSKDNPLLVYIIQSKEVKRSSRPDILKILILFYRFLFSFWLRKGIVFYGGYPYPEREKDGYYQRIRAIDSLFMDKWRIYIDSVRLSGRDFWYDLPEPRVLVLRPHGRGVQRVFIEFWIRLCILHARLVYFQSVLSTSGKEFFWENLKINKIIDVHGAVPEEFKYQGDENTSQYFDQVEHFVITHANYIVVVSNAMQIHLVNKYPGMIKGKFICLPNIQEFDPARYDKLHVNGKPVIIYAGGLQVWQQIPKIIDAIIQTYRLYEYKFYCPQPEKVLSMFPNELLEHHSIEIESKQRQEVFQEYRICHYGFILRDNRIVNNVSCPTKLVEYTAMGVIPIVDCPEIGDFKVLGMQYVNLDDLIKNQLPSESIRQNMAEQNSIVYSKLLQQYKDGVINLQRYVTPGGKPSQ